MKAKVKGLEINKRRRRGKADRALTKRSGVLSKILGWGESLPEPEGRHAKKDRTEDGVVAGGEM